MGREVVVVVVVVAAVMVMTTAVIIKKVEGDGGGNRRHPKKRKMVANCKKLKRQKTKGTNRKKSLATRSQSRLKWVILMFLVTKKVVVKPLIWRVSRLRRARRRSVMQ